MIIKFSGEINSEPDLVIAAQTVEFSTRGGIVVDNLVRDDLSFGDFYGVTHYNYYPNDLERRSYVLVTIQE